MPLDRIADILHPYQKPGFLPIAQAGTLNFSLINPGSQVLLRMMQDMRLQTLLPEVVVSLLLLNVERTRLLLYAFGLNLQLTTVI